MNICTSNEHLCTPRLRKAAAPLYVMRRERCRKSNRIENRVKSDNGQ
jgi:hypothetical protein